VIPIAEPSRQAGNLVNYDAEVRVQLQNELKFTHAHLITSKNFRGYIPGPPYKCKGRGRKEKKGDIGKGREMKEGREEKERMDGERGECDR
jgi:hypothetical protein